MVPTPTVVAESIDWILATACKVSTKALTRSGQYTQPLLWGLGSKPLLSCSSCNKSKADDTLQTLYSHYSTTAIAGMLCASTDTNPSAMRDFWSSTFLVGLWHQLAIQWICVAVVNSFLHVFGDVAVVNAAGLKANR